MRFSFLLITTIFLWACKKPENHQPTLLRLSDQQSITFLDSTNAAAAIISDTIEHFFDHINALDICIQLKRKLNPAIERDSLLKTYKQALKKDVLDFTPEEIDFIKNAFEDIFKNCSSLSEDIFPAEIRLIKIRGSHYGDGAFYTRENCIVIPQPELQNPENHPFRRVMLHELFHIYSRFNHQKKLEFYNLMGFKSVGELNLLQLGQPLKEKVLLNPDGVNYAYSIQLRDAEGTFNAIPIIVSNENDFVDNKPKFFDYLHFDLYEIIPPFSRLIKVDSNEFGTSTINYKNHPEFFEQITDNSSYIIHPDELMADNFVIAVLSQNDASELEKLSESGKRLIEKMVEIFQK